MGRKIIKENFTSIEIEGVKYNIEDDSENNNIRIYNNKFKKKLFEFNTKSHKLKTIFDKLKNYSIKSSSKRARNGIDFENYFFNSYNNYNKSSFKISKTIDEKYNFIDNNGNIIIKSHTLINPINSFEFIKPEVCKNKKSDFLLDDGTSKKYLELKSITKNTNKILSFEETIKKIIGMSIMEFYKYSTDSINLTKEMYNNGNITSKNITKSLKKNSKIYDFIENDTSIIFLMNYTNLDQKRFLYIPDILNNLNIIFHYNETNGKSVNRSIAKINNIVNKNNFYFTDNIEDIINHINNN